MVSFSCVGNMPNTQIVERIRYVRRNVICVYVYIACLEVLRQQQKPESEAELLYRGQVIEPTTRLLRS